MRKNLLIEGSLSLLPSDEQDDDDVLPIYPETEKSQPYPLEALGPIIGDMAKALHQIGQAPESICAQVALAGASICVQGLYDVEWEGRRSPSSLYLLGIASSGQGKSTVYLPCIKEVRSYWFRQIKDYRVLLNAYEIEKEEWERSKRKAYNLQPAEKRIELARMAKLKPLPPLNPDILTDQPTIEAVLHQLCTGRPSIGIYSDEASAFLEGYSMQDEKKGNAVATLSSLWDGIGGSHWRKSSPSHSTFNPRTSMCLLVQPEVSSVIKDPKIKRQGLWARFLMAAPERSDRRRERISSRIEGHPAAIAYQGKQASLLARGLTYATVGTNELSLKIARVSSHSSNLLYDFSQEMEGLSLLDEPYEDIREMVCKAAANAVRLSGVMAVMELKSSHVAEDFVIPDGCVERAIVLMRWYVAEYSRINGGPTHGILEDRAVRVLRHLAKRYQKGESFSLREISRNIIQNSAGEAAKVLQLLQLHGYVEPVKIRINKHPTWWRILKLGKSEKTHRQTDKPTNDASF